MKIKFIIKNLKIYGVPIVTVRLARILKEKGHQVEIITFHDDVEFYDFGGMDILCLNVPKEMNSTEAVFPYFEKWYKNADFDYVIAPSGEAVKIIAKINDKRLIPFIHNSDEYSYNRRNFYRRFKYRRILRKRLSGKHVICVSEQIRSFVERCCGKAVLSSRVLYNPFDINSIVKKATEYEFPFENGNYLLFVGRLERQKRVDRLLNAFSMINNKSIKLLILGEGVLENDLKALTQKLALQDRVVFEKFRSNPYPIMKSAKVLLLTSDHEGLPTVLIESLIVKTPVLSVDCPSGPSEILIKDLSQYLIRSFDESVIAKHIDSFIDESLLPNFSDGIENFTPEKVYESFMKTVDLWQSK